MSNLGLEARQGTGLVECVDVYQTLPLGRKRKEEKEEMNLFVVTAIVNRLLYVRHHILFISIHMI